MIDSEQVQEIIARHVKEGSGKACLSREELQSIMFAADEIVANMAAISDRVAADPTQYKKLKKSDLIDELILRDAALATQ